MEATILKALSKEPEDRYRSADAMLDDLEYGAPKKAVGTREAPKDPAPPARRRRRGRLALVSALALLLTLGGGTALANGMGYVELPSRQTLEAAFGQAEPVRSDPPPAPEDPVVPARNDAAAGSERDRNADRETPMVPVPDVRTYFDYSAEEILVNDGFDVEIVYAYQEGYADRGVAWGTDPAAGSLAPAGSTVTVYATPKDLYQPQIGG
jgi:serine/threonine-protein kinase